MASAAAAASLRRALVAARRWRAPAPLRDAQGASDLVPRVTSGAASSTAMCQVIGGMLVGAMVISGGSAPSAFSEELPAESWRSGKAYSLRRRIGKGTSCEVFEGISQTGSRCAVKILTSVKEDRLRREVELLEAMRGGPNIIELLDVYQAQRALCLVFEHVEKTPHKELYPTLSDREVRFYLHELVQALAHCHSQGVMHRDVKPQNVLIDHRERKLRLIDFGLAEFYRPEQEYSLRVSSLYYKAPELLCGLRRYDYGVDVWSLGCMLAALIFRTPTFFQGQDEQDQLVKISRVLGTDDLFSYLDKYGLRLDDALADGLRKKPKKPWHQFITEGNRHLVSEEAIDLLGRMLVYDHAARISMSEMLDHPYFNPVRHRQELESVVVNFQPGALGITAHPNGLVMRVDGGGQGARHGVATGWRIEGVGQQRFSVQLLKGYALGQHPYAVTFQKLKEAN